jgi:hypothetical protein
MMSAEMIVREKLYISYIIPLHFLQDSNLHCMPVACSDKTPSYSEENFVFFTVNA